MSIDAYSPSVTNLRNLLAIRCIALLGQAGVLAYVVVVSRTTESMSGLAASLIVLTVITIASLLRTNQPRPVSHAEFLSQLLVDVCGWTVLMYCSGGADNPFVSYYIVPLVVAAAVLPWRYTWLIAGASVAAYSLLLYYRQPFPLFSPHAGMHGDAGSVHRLGMWFNFLFSAGLITYFVVRMAAVLRRQENREAQRREQHLRNDQILAVASLAAGTAHELATPLSTMTVLVDEMLADPALSTSQREDCELLREQLRGCRETLRELSLTAEASSAGQKQLREITGFCDAALQHWSARRPRAAYRLQTPDKGQPPSIAYDQTLPQALENLLNNAADTQSGQIVVAVDWDQQHAYLSVRDQGPGLPPAIREALEHSAGDEPYTPVRQGMGIGLILTRATAERHGGQLLLDDAEGGGTIASLVLPLATEPGDD